MNRLRGEPVALAFPAVMEVFASGQTGQCVRLKSPSRAVTEYHVETAPN